MSADALRERALIVEALRLTVKSAAFPSPHWSLALNWAANEIEAGHYLGACPTPGSPGVPSGVSADSPTPDPATGAALPAGETISAAHVPTTEPTSPTPGLGGGPRPGVVLHPPEEPPEVAIRRQREEG